MGHTYKLTCNMADMAGQYGFSKNAKELFVECFVIYN